MIPLRTLAVGFSLAVGIDAFAVQVFVVGLYASTVDTGTPGVSVPPIAYSAPFTTATAMSPRLLGTDAFVVHVSVAGSYASTSPAYSVPYPDVPPMTYKLPFRTPATG